MGNRSRVLCSCGRVVLLAEDGSVVKHRPHIRIGGRRKSQRTCKGPTFSGSVTAPIPMENGDSGAPAPAGLAGSETRP